ncbi:MAG: hypothetical protein FWG71_05155 [Synergistaceae bacterium]|nr:hypothetical protein [Synergistaceae bacterium]
MKEYEWVMRKLRYVCFFVLALCAALLFVLAAPWGHAEADYEKGVAARAAGDYEEALSQWMVVSDDPRSMTAIGSLYDYGEGLPKDVAKAAEWYMKAAENGEYRAIAQLANFSLTGAGGVEQNPAEWRGRLEEIEGRDGYADYILASFCLSGYGGEKDIEKAYSLLDALVNRRGYSQLADELKRAEILLADKRDGVLDAETLINEMGRDRAAFEESYKDRRIVVNGLFRTAERVSDYGYVVRISGSQSHTIPRDNILAVFYEPSRAEELSSLKPGTLFKFSGVYVGDQPFPPGDRAFVLFGCALIGALPAEAQLP